MNGKSTVDMQSEIDARSQLDGQSEVEERGEPRQHPTRSMTQRSRKRSWIRSISRAVRKAAIAAALVIFQGNPASAGPPSYDITIDPAVAEIDKAVDDARLDDALRLAEAMVESSRRAGHSRRHALSTLARVRYERGEILVAEGLFRDLTAAPSTSKDDVDADAFAGLSEIATLRGETRTAADLCKQADAKLKSARRPTTRVRIRVLGCTAVASSEQPDAAERLLREALETAQRAFGPRSPRTVLVALALGDFFRTQGRLNEAQIVLTEASAAIGRDRGISHPLTSRAFFMIARLYQEQGKVADAEGGFSQGVNEAARLLGPSHPTTALARMELAGLQAATGRLGDAGANLRIALMALRPALGSNSPTVAVAELHLASLYMAMGAADQVDPLLDHAEGVLLASTEPGSLLRGILDMTVGTRDRRRGAHDAAVERLRKAHDTFVRRLGASAFNVASVRLELGRTELARGNAAEAIRWLDASVTQLRALGAPPLLPVAMADLAAARLAAGDRSEALRVRCGANEVRERLLNNALRLGSDEQRRSMASQAQMDMEVTLSLLATFFPQDSAAMRCAALALVRWKARALGASAAAVALLRDHPTATSPSLLDKLARSRASLAHEVWYAAAPSLDVVRARAEAHMLEASVSIEASAAFGLHDPGGIALEEVIRALPTGTAILEIGRFYPRSTPDALPRRSVVPHYVGIVIDAGGVRGFRDLGECEAVDAAVERFRGALRDPGSRDVREQARRLDELLWVPFEDTLRQAHRVIVAPEGSLTLVPFAALVGRDRAYRAEHHVISYVTSARDVIRWKEQLHAPGRSAVIGDPVFANLPSDLAKLRRLPAMQAEATAIRRMFPSATLLVGPEATEAAVKALRGPEVLHITTHGVFRASRWQPASSTDLHALDPSLTSEDEKNVARYAADDPMLRSALVLSGNQADRDGEDGLLSALEMAGLDLRGTKLVVLSACDTGMGALAASEGVLGLRRALVLAGARSQVLTLWPVDDAATERLVTDFYVELGRGADPAAALRSAQLRLLATPGFQHPYNWAGLTASGAPIPIVERRAAANNGPPPTRAGCGHCGAARPSHLAGAWAAPVVLACLVARRRRRSRLHDTRSST